MRKFKLTNSLTVDCDPEEVAELFELAASQFQRTEVPQHKVVISSIGLQFVAMGHQFIGQRPGVGDHLFGICLPGGLTSLQQSGSNTGDGLWKLLSDNGFIEWGMTNVVVGTALACREDSIIHSLLKVGCLLRIFPEEDQARPGSTQGFMAENWQLAKRSRQRVGARVDARSGGHNIASVEWVVEFPGSNQTACVGDVGHEEGTMLIGNCSELAVIPVSRVCGGATND